MCIRDSFYINQSKMVSIEQQSRSRLVQYYLTKNLNKKVAVRHYSDVGIKRSSFYSILENLKPEFLPKGKLEAVEKRKMNSNFFLISNIICWCKFSFLYTKSSSGKQRHSYQKVFTKTPAFIY